MPPVDILTLRWKQSRVPMGSTASAPVAAVTGHSTYQFGDITRGIMGIPRPPSPEPEPQPRRAMGFPFPGFTVTFPRPELTEDSMPMIEAEMRGTAIVAPLPAPRRFMPASTDPASGTATGGRSPTYNSVWDSFFNRAYEIAEMCLATGAITGEDIQDQEAYLYLGLPALTLLDGVMRSLPLPGDEMVMADGAVITHASCPQEFMPMYQALLDIKLAVIKDGVSDDELSALRLHVLHAGHEGSTQTPLKDVSTDRVTVLNRITAAVHSVATSVSQQPFFKSCFNTLLSLLAAQVPK